ncbi:MAG: serine/threonine-protein kinase [Planctomycetota bacterium]
MAISTVDEFLSALEKSKLLDSEQLVAAQRLAGNSPDASALAKALVRENLVSRWQAGTLLALGQRAQLRLGKYKLIQRLGKGGMGTVFLAEHVTMNRRVALKIVPRSIAENRASLDRFFAEARAIAALDHPNIVRAYSVDNEMDRYFIVMEFVEGQDLQRIVELNGPLDFDHAADYIRQAAEGLAHAHTHNLVHCDIKPANLLVTNQGVIKILDLGLARLNQSDEPRGAAAGEPAFGTVDYMAPEQAMETTNFDHRADIYSLGCTLYFLLTGHPPFPEGTLAQRIVKHQSQEPRDVLLDRPDTPPKLVKICKRMMAKEPENRYQSTQEVSTALAPWQKGSDGATGVRAPRAVKPLEDITPPAAPADDWLSFLAVPTTGMKKPATAAIAAKPPKPGKQSKHKGQSHGGIAAASAGGLTSGRTKFGWFNTTTRKILGAVAGIALLATVAGLAWFFPRHLTPAPQTPAPQTTVSPPKQEEKKGPIEDAVSAPPDKSVVKKPAVSKTSTAKDNSAAKTETSKKQPKNVMPKSADPNESKTNDPQKTDGKSSPNTSVKPEPPEKKPEPPAKPVEAEKNVSLDGLVLAVDLPQPGKGANDAVSLGIPELDPKLAVDVELIGGDAVAKGNPKFELQKEDDGPTPGWSVQMTSKNNDPVKIARVWQEESEWKIQWTAEAKDKATLVRYCGLQFSCKQKTRFVPLCLPKTVQPLAINVDTVANRPRSMSRGIFLPDPSVLRLQILPLDTMPKHKIEIMEAKGPIRPAKGKPIGPASGNTVHAKGRVIVTLTKDNTPHVFFGIGFDTKDKEVLLNMQATCDISGKERPFNTRNILGAATFAEYVIASEANPEPNKPKPEQIQAAKKAKEDLKALGELATDLKNTSIPFCVYAALGEGEAALRVVIFQSGPLENPNPGETPINPKRNKKGRDPH